MSMKVKFFYHHYWESKKDFEKEINDFMATVQVVDVKHSTVTVGDSDAMGAIASLLVLYK